jgi:hypothetical protein
MKKICYFFIDICLLIAAVIYSVFKFKKVSGTGWERNNFKKTILLANGPSLKDDIDKVIEESKTSEVYVLNFFAATEYFTKIKPEYYVLTDRLYWSQTANDDFKKDNENLFICLDRVDWKMNLVCPESGYKWISERLASNKNIRIIKVHSVNIEFKFESINLFALNQNLVTPHLINGLVLVLWHAIIQKTPKIEIYGADFSLFKEYYVNQESNEVYNSMTHFYKNTKAQKIVAQKYPNEPKKMLHTKLLQTWSSFYQMYLLSKLGKIRNIKIINCSSNSYLDCFERQK